MKIYKFTDIEKLNDALVNYSEAGVRVLYTQIKIVDKQEQFYVFTDENSVHRGTQFSKYEDTN